MSEQYNDAAAWRQLVMTTLQNLQAAIVSLQAGKADKSALQAVEANIRALEVLTQGAALTDARNSERLRILWAVAAAVFGAVGLWLLEKFTGLL